jgi:uncharacterized protein YggE
MTRLVLNRALHPVGIAAGLLAAALFALPARAAGGTPPIGLITMSGQGRAAAVPDEAQLSAGVVSEAKAAATALGDNNHKMRAVFAALKALGIKARNIQTSGFSVSPQYPAYNSKQPRHIIGYRVANTVRVKLDDMKKLGAALDALVSAGANQINNVGFAIADPKPLQAKAREEAVTDATEKAKAYARAAGVTLGPVQSIDERGGSGPRPVAMMALRKSDDAVPVAAGEETVSAQVTIAWQIR